MPELLTDFIASLTVSDGLLALLWISVMFLQGLCGMGSALIAIPFMTLMMPVHCAILTCCAVGPCSNLLMVILHGRHARGKSLVSLIGFSIPGAVVGLLIITAVSGMVLQTILAGMLMAFLLWQYFGRVTRGKETLGLSAFVGGAAGLFGTAIGIDGPPIGAYGLYAQWQPREFLGTLAVFFFIRGAISFGMQFASGLYTPEIWHSVLIVIPSAYLGLVLSFPFAKRINPNFFRLAVKWIIFLCALMSLAKAVMG